MQPGDLLYFTPFQFTDPKATPKNKYFLVLGYADDKVVVSNLPTSQDHVPSHLSKVHGCIQGLNGDSFNCYFFGAGIPITTCGWSFQLDTYVYGEQITTFELADARFNPTLLKPEPYRKMGSCTPETHRDLLACLSQGVNVKTKYKRLFERILKEMTNP